MCAGFGGDSGTIWHCVLLVGVVAAAEVYDNMLLQHAAVLRDRLDVNLEHPAPLCLHQPRIVL
jgi:hypothetical protein